MHQSDQEALSLAYQAARELLEQTRDYLLRLPPVPVTRDLARRIDEHLSAPSSSHVRHMLDATMRSATTLRWQQWMPNGEPLLSARLELGRNLSLSSIRLASRPNAAAAVIDALDKGLAIELESEEEIAAKANRRGP